MADHHGAAGTLPRLEPGAMFAGYRIEGLLDRGGMGIVYTARDPDLDRLVALKIIAPEYTRDPTAVARFKSEARLAASLEHPNIVPVHRGGEHDGVLFIAMRYVQGSNLRHVIDAGPVPLPRLASIIDKVADALDTAHDRGLVHRDVKPANILICAEGNAEQVYLTDFGLTKHLGSISDLTHTGNWVGTPDYVAPEQIQGLGVDRRADVYSLGCVVYEMLTGQVAYPRDSQMAKLWAHVTDPPPLPRARRADLVPAWDDVIARATAKDLDDRYATAGDLAAGVRDAIAQQNAKRTDGLQRPAGAATNAGAPTAGATAPAGTAGYGSTRGEGPEPVPPPPPIGPPPVGGDRGHGARPGRGPGRRRALLAAGLVALAAAAAVVVILATGSGGSSTASGDQANASLAFVPFSKVNGFGKVRLDLNGNVAKVALTADGLLAANAHLLHIHAGKLGECPPGSAARKHDGHLVITTEDGAPYYGPVQTSLTTSGTTSAKVLHDFARFPSGSKIDYRRTVNLGPVTAAQVRANQGVIIVHGIDYNRNQKYDPILGVGEGRTVESTAPALCGPLKFTGSQAAGGSRVYVATLAPARDRVPASPLALLCALPGELKPRL
jgi:Protein kinase domain